MYNALEYSDKLRCKKCEHKRIIQKPNGLSYTGCAHAPYQGKWVLEIRDCPKRSEQNDRNFKPTS
jgi:hypothetical protein